MHWKWNLFLEQPLNVTVYRSKNASNSERPYIRVLICLIWWKIQSVTMSDLLYKHLHIAIDVSQQIQWETFPSNCKMMTQNMLFWHHYLISYWDTSKGYEVWFQICWPSPVALYSWRPINTVWAPTTAPVMFMWRRTASPCTVTPSPRAQMAHVARLAFRKGGTPGRSGGKALLARWRW